MNQRLKLMIRKSMMLTAKDSVISAVTDNLISNFDITFFPFCSQPLISIQRQFILMYIKLCTVDFSSQYYFWK